MTGEIHEIQINFQVLLYDERAFKNKSIAFRVLTQELWGMLLREGAGE